SAVGRATGFIIDRERRLLVTTALAVGPHERVELIFPKLKNGAVVAELAAYKEANRGRAIVLARDARRNLALLEAEELPVDAPTLSPAEESAQPGDALHA